MDAGTQNCPTAHWLVYRRPALRLMERRQLSNTDRCVVEDVFDIFPADTGTRNPGANSKAPLGHYPQRTCGDQPLDLPIFQGYLGGRTDAGFQPRDTRLELPGNC